MIKNQDSLSAAACVCLRPAISFEDFMGCFPPWELGYDIRPGIEVNTICEKTVWKRRFSNIRSNPDSVIPLASKARLTTVNNSKSARARHKGASMWSHCCSSATGFMQVGPAAITVVKHFSRTRKYAGEIKARVGQSAGGLVGVVAALQRRLVLLLTAENVLT